MTKSTYAAVSSARVDLEGAHSLGRPERSESHTLRRDSDPMSPSRAGLGVSNPAIYAVSGVWFVPGIAALSGRHSKDRLQLHPWRLKVLIE